jgi:hypothetical protein
MRRFPAPWSVKEDNDRFTIKDANGFTVVWVCHREDLHSWDYQYANNYLSRDEARRIAKAISRLPEFLKAQPEFPARRVNGAGRYWRSSHPYHVALQECYVQENYDAIDECCRFNKVPFDPTGEKLNIGLVRWIVYEFAYPFDAIRFWHKFNGRWMLGDEFIAPTPPRDFRPMQSLKHKGAL